MPRARKAEIVVSAVVISKGKVLLIEHSKLKKWLFPGGHIEPNEIPDDAVIREVKEETNLDISFSDYSTLSGTSDEIEKVACPLYTTFHSVGDHDHFSLCYRVMPQNPEQMRNNKESTNIGWFDARQVGELKNIPDSTKRVALACLSR